ncbi:CCR4-NOT transcription complex subunit 4-like isoform X2 [Oncorhynchus masou masou]|uniref:CCR4-NOT transcription complex subunit 4-like isoform X2 n=1 Tax=Oncorhynchus masou masou TaxID=90313 RepID=UPI0031842A81
MSHSPEMKDDSMECPLCMEPLEIDDVNFFPCTCGYQICRFCWHRIRTDENGLCPACRKPYPEDPAVYKPLSQEEIQRIKNEKKQKQNEKKQKVTENRKHLASVRVVQRNLVFVVGLSQRLADPEVLKRPEYFGKFGKIHKVVINNSTSYAGSQGPSASAYVTYIRSEDALRAIQCVNNVVVDGRTLKASLGTTKYCSYFLKSMQCPKPDCMYLHELGDEAASFTKEEMQAGKHQEYEQTLLQDLYKMNPSFLQTSPCAGEKSKSRSSNSTHRPNNGKDGWPILSGYGGKLANGLSEDRKSPPLLDCCLDPEGMTSDGLGLGLDTELGMGSGQGAALSPFSSNCDSNSPSDKPPESISMVNGETLQQMPNSESPSSPPGLTRPPSSLVVPISVVDLTARSPFEGAAAESQSLFSDNSNFRQPNPIPSGLPPFPNTPRGGSDWPMTPEPQSLFASDTIPVSSSTDWQAAFGFGSSSKTQQQDDDLGFDPFDITRKALADLIEKELSVQDQPSPLGSPGPFSLHHPGSHHGLHLPPSNPNHFPSSLGPPPRLSQLHHRQIYSSFSFPGSQSQSSHQAAQAATASRHPWMDMSPSARSNNHLSHLNHSANAGGGHGNFLDLSMPPQRHSTGLGGIPISESSCSIDGLNVKEWQAGLRALLPNININFGGLPNSSSSSSSSSSVNHIGRPNHLGGPGGLNGPGGLSHSLSWDGTASWMDPAIITGIPASTGNSLDLFQEDQNPPHWLKSLQALTEMDGPALPSSSLPQQPQNQQHLSLHSHHHGLLDQAASHPHLPLHHRAGSGWAPYLPSLAQPTQANPSQFHSPPPGFQTAFRPPGQSATELLNSTTAGDRH